MTLLIVCGNPIITDVCGPAQVTMKAHFKTAGTSQAVVLAVQAPRKQTPVLQTLLFTITRQRINWRVVQQQTVYLINNKF